MVLSTLNTLEEEINFAQTPPTHNLFGRVEKVGIVPLGLRFPPGYTWDLIPETDYLHYHHYCEQPTHL